MKDLHLFLDNSLHSLQGKEAPAIYEMVSRSEIDRKVNEWLDGGSPSSHLRERVDLIRTEYVKDHVLKVFGEDRRIPDGRRLYVDEITDGEKGFCLSCRIWYSPVNTLSNKDGSVF